MGHQKKGFVAFAASLLVGILVLIVAKRVRLPGR